MSSRVLISIVTYNSARYLQSCLDSISDQTFRDFSISLWDNASTDGTGEIIARNGKLFGFSHISAENIGFCAAHNRLISSADSDYILVLNPDVVLDRSFIETLVTSMDDDRSAGSATGKLWRSGNQTATKKILDSTGIYFTPNQRHFDRGSGEPDRGQYDTPEYVFGASGAAAFYRRAMLLDIGEGDSFFDEHFFAYREDADLAWRAQWLGWRCLYVPQAMAYHVRRVLPERRRALPDIINMHSFKNRFLMRLKNMDMGTYARYFIPITLRDLAILGYVLLFERSSMRAIPLIFRAFPDAWAVRKSIRGRKRISGRELRAWFSNRPIAKKKEPAPEVNRVEGQPGHSTRGQAEGGDAAWESRRQQSSPRCRS